MIALNVLMIHRWPLSFNCWSDQGVLSYDYLMVLDQFVYFDWFKLWLLDDTAGKRACLGCIFYLVIQYDMSQYFTKHHISALLFVTSQNKF